MKRRRANTVIVRAIKVKRINDKALLAGSIIERKEVPNFRTWKEVLIFEVLKDYVTGNCGGQRAFHFRPNGTSEKVCGIGESEGVLEGLSGN